MRFLFHPEITTTTDAFHLADDDAVIERQEDARQQ
jgi:hypothetical protein